MMTQQFEKSAVCNYTIISTTTKKILVIRDKFSSLEGKLVQINEMNKMWEIKKRNYTTPFESNT